MKKAKEKIIEISIVELDLDTGKVQELFNNLVKEAGFDESYKNSWIFKKKYVNFESILDARFLNSFRSAIQGILNNYKVAAFNKAFDFHLLRSRGFLINKELPCIMIQATNILKIPGKKGKYKWPKLQEVWNFYFPVQPFKQKHRAYDDAHQEALILYRMYQDGDYFELEFSKELQEIYSNVINLPYEQCKIKDDYYHCPQNEAEGRQYVISKFPLHISKARQLLREFAIIPKIYGKIAIIDMGCGPYTFSQAIMEELIVYGGKSSSGMIDLKIFGVDRSQNSLKYGSRMLELWKEIFKQKQWKLEYKPRYDDGNFEDIPFEISQWLDNFGDYYVFLGFLASSSSGLTIIEQLVPIILKEKLKKPSYCLILEPDKYSNCLFFPNLRQNVSNIQILEKDLFTSCKKPQGMKFYLKPSEKEPKSIKNEFKALVIRSKYYSIIDEIIARSQFNSVDHYLIFMNKAINWLKGQKFVDSVEINLYKHFLPQIHRLLDEFFKQIKTQKYLQYYTSKGLNPEKEQKFALIPLDICIFSFIILETVGRDLDQILSEKVLGSRINKMIRLNRTYQYFTLGFIHYCFFDKKCLGMTKSLCKGDIKSFFPSINKEKLREKLSCLLEITQDSTDLNDIFFNLIGNEEGIPIGLPISPLLANIFLFFFDDIILANKYTINYRRYMDDFKIYVRFPKTDENTKMYRCFLNKILEDLNLKLSEDKFSITNIERNNISFKYAREFEEYSKKYYNLTRYLQKGLIKFVLYNISNPNIKQKLCVFAKNLSKILLQKGIFFDSTRLRQFLLLCLHKIRDYCSDEEIVRIESSKNTFQLAQSSLDSFDTIVEFEILNKNRSWFTQCWNFSKFLYKRMGEEMKHWDTVLVELDRVNQNKCNTNEKTVIQDRIKELREKSEEFLLSNRMIRFLGYRLTRILTKNMNDPKNTVTKKLKKFIQLGVPIKLLCLISSRYADIQYLETCAEKIREMDPASGTNARLISSNNLAYILSLLVTYYQDNLVIFHNKLKNWEANIRTAFSYGYYIEKLAYSEFTLRMKIIDHFSYQEWNNWIEQSNEAQVIRNLIICLAYHPDSPPTIPDSIRIKLVSSLNTDSVTVSLLNELWIKIKTLKSFDLFDTIDPFAAIQRIPYDFDLDYEFNAIFDAEDEHDDFGSP